MFKRKKFMALCATTLAGLSALGSFAPMAASADVAKNGDTVVTYEGAPKPAEWGLSVPANVKLDKSSNVAGSNIHYGNMKVGIVDDQGQSLVDATKDRTFSVSGKGTGTNGNLSFTDKSGQKYNNFLYAAYTGNQGDSEPTTMTKAVWDAASNDATKLVSNFETKADGSNANAEKWVQFGVNEAKQGFNKNTNYSETISWTATEK
ncbi:hypothetical protein [Lactococcus lactis]|uniref:Cell surface protein n=1 Tax=Lactococcus lactis TaxID=1358 RepID=A0AAW5TQH3_9LACT|nr:hypothetical protein [Lactococcus lactis]MCW2282231.1 hypothetical protein [Lactococcus lactis]